MTPLQRLRKLMAERAVTGLMVSDPTNVGWLTGFTGSFARVLVTHDQIRFLTDSRYTIQSQEQVSGIPIFTFASPMDGDVFTASQVREMGLPEIYFEAANTTYATFERLQQKFGDLNLLPAADLFGELRMVKSPDEIAKIRAACELADKAFDHLLRMVQPGVTEFDINLELEFFFRRQGAEIAFPPIVVSGERSARPHGHASEKKLEFGDFLTLDFGAGIDGYNSDITRTVVVGKASDRHREVYQQVLKAQLASLEMMRPGVAAKDVDARAREVLNELDLAKYFGHGLGHGLGRLVHDGGRLSSASTDTLAVGQVWTVEPGVYIEGFGGVRIEDDVVVTENGIEILTHSTKELLELPA